MRIVKGDARRSEALHMWRADAAARRWLLVDGTDVANPEVIEDDQDDVRACESGARHAKRGFGKGVGASASWAAALVAPGSAWASSVRRDPALCDSTVTHIMFDLQNRQALLSPCNAQATPQRSFAELGISTHEVPKREGLSGSDLCGKLHGHAAPPRPVRSLQKHKPYGHANLLCDSLKTPRNIQEPRRAHSHALESFEPQSYGRKHSVGSSAPSSISLSAARSGASSGSSSHSRSTTARGPSPKSGPYQSSSLVHVSVVGGTSHSRSASRNARADRARLGSRSAAE